MKKLSAIKFNEESRKTFVKGFTTNKKIALKKRAEEEKKEKRREKRRRGEKRKKEKLKMVLNNMSEKP